MLSHQLQQNTIDGEKTIIQNPNEAQRKEYEKCTFDVNEVYAVDVLISTGEGQVSYVINSHLHGLKIDYLELNQFLIIPLSTICVLKFLG